MNTDTPRTDEWETYCDECYYHLWRVRKRHEKGFNDGYHVHNGDEAKDLCKTLNNLERELAEAREEIDQLKSQLTKTHGSVTISRNGYVEELEKQRDGLAEELDNLKQSILNLSHPNMKLILIDIAEVREQRDRLADAMREMWTFIEEDDYGSLNTPAFSAAIKKYKQALDDVKGESQ
jgi:chromosome segregation ATPase